MNKRSSSNDHASVTGIDSKSDDKVQSTEEKQETDTDASSYAAAAGVLGIEKSGQAKHPELEQEWQAKVEQLQEEASQHKDKMLRAMAELDNVRRIAQRDIANAHKYGTEKMITDLLAVVDSLERGLETCEGDQAFTASVREGLELTHKMFLDVLQKHGVSVIDPTGEKFDPDQHEAVSMQPAAEVEPNTIITVFQRGYLLNGRVIRAAKVVVAKNLG